MSNVSSSIHELNSHVSSDWPTQPDSLWVGSDYESSWPGRVNKSRLVEFAGSQIIRVFLSGYWLARISATADWWAEKLSIRRATFHPVILESNQRINSIKIWVVIQAFELLRQNRLKFRILMPAALKACGFRAFPINQGSSFSEPSALQQNRAESLAFSFFCPGSCWVERLRAGVCFQRSAVSSQLNWSLRL